MPTEGHHPVVLDDGQRQAEAGGLLDIYALIDRLAQVSPELVDRAELRRWVGPYRVFGSKLDGWSQKFDAWRRPQERLTVDATVALVAALGRLSAVPPFGRRRAARLGIVVVVVRVLRSLSERAEVRAALVAAVRSLGDEITEEGATNFVIALARIGPQARTPETDWKLVTWLAEDTLGIKLGRPLGPSLCTDELSLVDSPDGTAALALLASTRVELPNASLAGMGMLVDPPQWPGYSAFWQGMRECEPFTPVEPEKDAATGVFLEKVALHVNDDLITPLRFTKLSVPGKEMILDYELETSVASTCAGDGRVVVDEGSVRARQQGGSVIVETTKKLRFAPPLDGVAGAMVLCALGWLTAAEDMAEAAAGKGPPSIALGDHGAQHAGGAHAGDTTNRSIEDLAREFAAESAGDHAARWQGALAKSIERRYGSDQLAIDTSACVAQMLRDGARLVSLGIAAGASTASLGKKPGA